jgi:hypothetical protein
MVCVNDFGDGTIYVMFSAVEVKKAVQKILDESTVYGIDRRDGRCGMSFRISPDFITSLLLRARNDSVTRG